MKTTITVLILGLVCLSNIAQAKFFGYEGSFAEEVAIREQAYHNEATIDSFFSDLKHLIDTIKQVNAAIPKGSRSPISEIDELSKIKLDMCVSCENTVWAARNATDKDAMKEKLEKYAEDLCETKENSSVCTEAVSRYGEVIWPAVMDRTFDANRLCQKLHFCPDTTKKQNIKDYVDEVLADKPATKIPTPTKKSSYTIMQLTDPHIDLEYQEGAASVCSQPLCCRASDGQPSNASEAAGYWGTIAYCDIPLRTFDQFLQFTSKNFDIDMIVWTGDNIAHNVWEQSQDNQTVNTYDATQHILQYFPNTTVYPMFGNHEAFPCDEFDFIGNNSAWLTSQLADMWKVWLDEDSLSTLRANSYYSVVNPVHNVKIIALDTVACDAIDFYLFEDPTDPQNQLAWLRNELYASESAGQAVFIIGHIPPGEFTCDSEWSSRYRALVDRFTNIIRGQFFGHTHDDEIEVVRSWADDTPVGVVHIAPSLTTYSNLQPSFRIFEIDSDTHVILNYYQYRLDLNKANQNTTGPLTWDLAYDVLSEYSLADMTFVSFDNLAEKIKQDEATAELYQFNKYSGTDKKKKMNARDVQHLYCKAKNSVSQDAFKCLGLDATTSDMLEIAAQSLPGAWTYTTF